MSRFREEMNVIAPGMWVLAAILYVVLAICLLFVAPRADPEINAWPAVGKAAFGFGIPAIVFVYTLLVGYVFRDAQRRGMRHVMWTLLAIFIPNTIGFILYFIFRDPILQGCPQCGAAISTKFPYCPKCGAARTKTCPQCRNAVEPGWSHCAKCGAKL